MKVTVTVTVTPGVTPGDTREDSSGDSQVTRAAAAAAPLDASAALPAIAQLADRLRLLSQEASYAARSADPLALAEVSERLLPLHVEYARRYRTWLARRTGTDDSVSY